MRMYVLIFILISISSAHATGLPDTGQNLCYQGPGLPLAACTELNTGDTADYPGQDGRYGRDPAAALGQLPKTGAGEFGRDYTKVCNSGELAGAGDCPDDPIPGNGNNEWACTQDNVTGLMWEVKTDDEGLRDRDWKYSWYNTDTSTNGGHAGSPDNDDDHWDVIEGQGSLFHPGYSGVSLGLLHGSQPDAFVLCHDATRTVVSGWEHYDLPSIQDAIDQHVLMGSRTNPDIQCVGISVNTSQLPADERLAYLAKMSEETGLPCVDSLIDGCGAIVDRIKQLYPEG